MQASIAAVNAFRESMMSTDSNLNLAQAFIDPVSRHMRYKILWTLFENTAYRKIHTWSTQMKTQYGLYKYIRNIYNPANRLGIFWQTHLLGGPLDPAAGDGQAVPSSIPILTANEVLRPALQQLWLNSNWSMQKDVWTLMGSVLGDCALKVIDDPLREKVYLQPVNPSTLLDVMFDPWGNVKGYIIEEIRIDPEREGQTALYREIAGRDGDSTVYQTLRNGSLYKWNGEHAEWRENYGFIPMVTVKHFDVGLDFGWAEIYPLLSKAREVDDQASKLNDYIRKMVDAPFLFTGVKKPTRGDVTLSGATPTADRPEPGREEIPAMYADAGAAATPLVANLSISETSANIKDLLTEIERDLPELQHDIWSSAGNASGRALRVSRERVTSKVLMRRTNYDNGLVRAQQMAIGIGGYRGYPGFEGFDLDSYGAGKLDHTIGARPVFDVDPLDDAEIDLAFWTAARTATQTGIPIEIYLRKHNWAQTDIDEVLKSNWYMSWMAAQGGMP